MKIDRKYLDELQDLMNNAASRTETPGIDAYSVMVEDKLNQFAREVMQQYGVPVPEGYKILDFHRDPQPALDSTGRANGHYNPTEQRIHIFGDHVTNAMQALLVTAHECEHVVQDFTFKGGFDTMVEQGQPLSGPEFNDHFNTMMNGFFANRTSTDPIACDSAGYANKLQSDPFYARDSIAILRDDHNYYTASVTALYESNTQEMQANAGAFQTVAPMVDMHSLHDMEQYMMLSWIENTRNQCRTDLDVKESPEMKRQQLREAGGSRFFLNKNEQAFMVPKDTAELNAALNQIVKSLSNDAMSIISTDSLEKQTAKELYRQAEEKAVGEIDDIAKTQGFNYLPEQIDMKEIQGGIYYGYDSMQSMRDVLMTQFIRMDPELHDRVFIDLNNKRIVIDGARDIAHMLADPERTPDIDLDADLTRESLEERGVDGEYHTPDLDLMEDEAGLEL